MSDLLQLPPYPLIGLVFFFNILVALIGALILRLIAKEAFWSAFFPVLALSLLGFVTGITMSSSREAAVGAVLPAVLTLLGGLLVYLTGSAGVPAQAPVSVMVVCFVFSFFFGAGTGSRLRVGFENAQSDPTEQRDRELAQQDNRHAVEVRKLKQYLEFLELKRDLANQNNLDLSGYKSIYETEPPAK